mmetsp:Transcript_7447/g.22019  ORF Transcript_7447/g.22019 Transcript_7447/m.22019 type:complete len:345 (-) Transcript_7447:33-1067(-)
MLKNLLNLAPLLCSAAARVAHTTAQITKDSAAARLARGSADTSALAPVIGVFAHPASEDRRLSAAARQNGGEYVAASYVKFIEMAGGVAVPLSYGASNETMATLLRQLNGVLLPGGGAGLPDSARAAIQYGLDHPDFPVWGTCLGFEWLVEAIGGTDILTGGYDAENVSLALDLEAAAEGSMLLGGARRAPLRFSLAAEALAMNNHEYGVTPEDFAASPGLSGLFDVLSTNADRQGKRFVSTIEAPGYKIFGVQWHPEKNAFETGAVGSSPYEAINHSPAAVDATYAMARTLVDAASANAQSFDSPDDRDARLFYHCKSSDVTYPEFVSSYFFDASWTGAEPAC